MAQSKNTPSMRPSHQAMERQTVYDPDSKIFTAHCGICGKVRSEKKEWFRSRNGTMRRLRLRFNFCNTCNRWVCSDCFLIDDGTGGIGICTECAKEQGITGYTSAQFREILPERQRYYRELHEAARQAELEQKKSKSDRHLKRDGGKKDE